MLIRLEFELINNKLIDLNSYLEKLIKYFIYLR